MTAPLEAALHYAELGYRVFPCVPGGKIPATAHGCLDATSDTETISRWWAENPARNVAISTDGFCVVDVDVMKDGSENVWLKAVPESIEPGAASITPRGGLHWWFRQNGVPLRNTTSRIKDRVDTRADGGYVVVPPSRTENGGYSWSEDLPLPPADSLPVIPEWIERQLVGDGGLFEDKQQSKAESKQQSKAPIVGAVASHAADGDAIPEGQRNHTLASLGGTLRRQGFSQTAIEAALLATNQERCKPPLPTDEVRQIAKSVSRYEPDQIAQAVAEDTASTVFDNGTGSAITGGADKSKQRIQTAAERFPIFDGKALDDLDCRVDYLIHNFLVAGQPCIVAGPKKSLKTGTLVDMAVSLASGTQCLNTFAVGSPRNVLLMTGESGEGTIQETARRIAESKGLDLRDLDRFKVAFNLPRLAEAADLVRLEDLIGTHKFDVVMVDPAYLAFSGLEDAGNLFAVGSMLWPLTEIGQRTGATIIIAHHTKKNLTSPFAQPELGDIAWSGFAEWARQWVLLNRREPYDPESGGVHHLWLSVGGSAGHGGAWSLDISEGRRTDIGGRFWSVALGSAREEKESREDDRASIKDQQKERRKLAQVEADAAKLLRAIQKFPDGETERTLRESVGLSGTRSGPAFMLLEDRGDIQPVEIQKSGRPYSGYRLTSGTSGTEWDTTGTSPASVPAGPTGTGTRGCGGKRARDLAVPVVSGDDQNTEER